MNAKVRESLRDLIGIFVTGAITALVAVVSAGNPISLVLIPVLWKAGLAAVVASVIAWLTPLTRRYGVGSKNVLVEEHLEKVPV